MGYIISQFLAIISALLFLWSVLQKENKNLFVISSVESTLNIVKNILLGGYSGVVVQALGTIRSISKARRKFNGVFAGSIIVVQIALGALINKAGVIGYLPVLASVGYSVLIMRTENNTLIKLGLVLNLLLWTIYNLSLRDYVGAITNTLYAMITLVITIHQYCVKSERKKRSE